MKLLAKQENAVFYLKDSTTTEIYYGGAAGGGKSALGCLWLIENCQKHPGTRWMMGRAKLDTLKATTLKTFFELSSKLKISNQFEYNAQNKTIVWSNGSEIILKDLFSYPADPEFDSLGSLEITGAFIDECPQIDYKAWQIVRSRTRYKLKEFNLIPKILGTGNPSKGWAYSEFYKPFREGSLKKSRAFIQSLPTDNPHLPESYSQTLLELDKNSRERLYYGNWEYDDSPDALINFDNILNLFTNTHVPGGDKYITADIARMGSDKAVILVWDGLIIIDMVEYAVSLTTEIQEAISTLKVKYSVPNNNIIADSDGVGGGVVDNLRIKGFVNNSRAVNDENFQNLKSQCYYKLAEKINANEIYFKCELSSKQKENIIEELEQVKSFNTDNDGKLRIIPKDQVKQNIGRSPDYSDALMMYMFFVLIPQKKAKFNFS